MKPLKVLSLFDGISCGQLALHRADIPVDVYYASEIDKNAIAVTQKNFPDTIKLGDITKIDFTQFIGKIDLIMGGSPCQDLSIAGNRVGLQGDRSGLFYKFVEAIEVIKPKYYLLENNFGMPDEAYEEISQLMGCYPIMINSALVSAQNRRRFYWFNWGEKSCDIFGFPTCDIPQPKDKGIVLQDILQSGVAPKKKTVSCCATDYKGLGAKPLEQCHYHTERPFAAEILRVPENTKKGYVEIKQGECVDLTHINFKTRRGRKMTDKCNCLMTSNDYFQFMYQLPHGYNKGRIIRDKAPCLTISSWENSNLLLTPIRLKEYEKSAGQAQRAYSVKGKTVCLNANGGGQGGKTGLYKIDLPDGEYIIRKLSPVECERLQTLPDNYTDTISKSQRYKTIGNGWTVDVIAHIFGFLRKELENK